jgi:type IV secretory pathway VirB3-like protein
MTAGVPERGIVLLFMLAVVFVYGMKMIFMIGPVILLYIIMKALSAKDPYMIDIVLDNVQQKDVLLP